MDGVVSVINVAELKAQPGNTDNVVLTTGTITKGDLGSALYYFDPLDTTTADDTVNYNTVVPTSGIGRWKKVITRTMVLPHGTLYMNAGKRDFFCNSVTAADGTCLINLTMDNTTNGTPIFTEVLFDDSKANINLVNINDAIGSCRKLLSANKKQLTHVFYTGNTSALNVAVIASGVTTSAFKPAPTGTSVIFAVTGK